MNYSTAPTIEIGDRVTSKGRHGAGQPPITGVVSSIARDRVFVRTDDGSIKVRTIPNLRRVEPPVGYAFRIGNRYYPAGVSRWFATIGEARVDAQFERTIGNDVGRIKRCTEAERDEHARNIRCGILSI